MWVFHFIHGALPLVLALRVCVCLSSSLVMRCISIETARKKQKVATILLHPGTVDTDMSKPFQRNVPEGKLFTPQYSVERLLGIIDKVTQDDNGKLYAWDGQPIPW